MLTLAHKLNADNDLIQSLIKSGIKPGGVKAEAYLLTELVQLYQMFPSKEDERSKFVLAYYYDVLRNQTFADENDVDKYDLLISSNDFNNLLGKIKRDYSVNSLNGDTYSFPFAGWIATHSPEDYEKVLSFYENFLFYAFGLKYNKKENFGDVIGVKKNTLPTKSIAKAIPQDDSLEKVLKELNELVGLENVKKDVLDLINFLEVQKKREKKGLKNTELTLHTVFLGPPGTGKTTVARLLGRIYKHLGYLSKGQLIETDREGLIAGFVGQTATKVDKVIEDSLGGVLFIDEAYALNQTGFGNDYGAEAISTLLKRMEDHRDDLAVVVAGYTEPMKIFIESNPGLRSRFNRYFHFDHFKPKELLEVFKSFCQKSDFSSNADADEKLLDTFELCYEKRDDGFGNARDVRNIFEMCVQNHANRIIKLKNPNKEILRTLTEEDIPEPKEIVSHIQFFSNKE